MGSCRSSGVVTIDTLVSAERCRLVSIHAQLTGLDATTIKVFDSADGLGPLGKELARMILAVGVAPAQAETGTIEFDMHGVIAVNGLFLQISTGGQMGAAVSVEYN